MMSEKTERSLPYDSGKDRIKWLMQEDMNKYIVTKLRGVKRVA